jgi:hypothetical protein
LDPRHSRKDILKRVARGLIKDAGLSDAEVDRIMELYSKWDQLRSVMKVTPFSEKEILLKLAKEVEEIDFALQDAWKMSRDKRYHTLWFQVPHCICPKEENWNAAGTERQHKNPNCPLHGQEED